MSSSSLIDVPSPAHVPSTDFVRITARIRVGAFAKNIDVSVPTGSSFGDMLPELMELVHAPSITRPWRVSDAAGSALDLTTPVADLGLLHGSVVVICPMQPVEPPIVTDAAGAVAQASSGTGAAGLGPLSSVVGCGAVAWALSGWLPAALALLIGAALLLVILIWTRPSTLLTCALGIAASAASFLAVPHQRSDTFFPTLTCSTTLGLITAICAVLRTASTRTLTMMGATAAILFVSSPGALLNSDNGLASTTIVAALIVSMYLPTWAISWAGLKVPVLPSAGQSLSLSDDTQPDLDARARTALHLADGMSLAAAVVSVPAFLVLGHSHQLTAQLLCLVVGLAAGIHSLRVATTWPAWALGVTGVAGLGAAVLATSASSVSAITTAVAGLCLLSSGWWGKSISSWAPTSIAWLERAEKVALIATLPLAAWASGLVALVRGMG